MKQFFSCAIAFSIFSQAFSEEAVQPLIQKSPLVKPSVKIALVNTNDLQNSIGYSLLKSYEYGKKYRTILKEIHVKVSTLEDKLIEAKDNKALDKIATELAFIQRKKASLESLARVKSSRSGSQKAELKALIKTHFKNQYPIILLNQSSTNLFTNSIHSNIKYIDITDEVKALLLKEMTAVE